MEKLINFASMLSPALLRFFKNAAILFCSTGKTSMSSVASCATEGFLFSFKFSSISIKATATDSLVIPGELQIGGIIFLTFPL